MSAKQGVRAKCRLPISLQPKWDLNPPCKPMIDVPLAALGAATRKRGVERIGWPECSDVASLKKSRRGEHDQFLSISRSE